MKTQPWGNSATVYCIYDIYDPIIARLLKGNVGRAEFNSWHWSDSFDGSLKYKEYRANGTDIDSPSRPFPYDGVYTWDEPDRVFTSHGGRSRIRYTEGPLDKVWMGERDRNYVFRLEREGRLDATEPNLQREVPALYTEIMIAKQTRPRQARELGAERVYSYTSDDAIEKSHAEHDRIIVQENAMFKFVIKVVWKGGRVEVCLYDTREPNAPLDRVERGQELFLTDPTYPGFWTIPRGELQRRERPTLRKIRSLLSSLKNEIKVNISWTDLCVSECCEEVCSPPGEIDISSSDSMQKLNAAGFRLIEGRGIYAIFTAGPFPYNNGKDIILKLREILQKIDPTFNDELRLCRCCSMM